MRAALQFILLKLYQCAVRSGALSTRPGRAVFTWCYEVYKARIEAGNLKPLLARITPGSCVIDVGANIGFFTKQFARSVSQGGKVIAIEPEPQNFETLNDSLKAAGLTGVVDALQAVAAEADGQLKLALNPFHHADHRIASEGIAVTSVTLDSILAKRGWPPVSLVKVDVQGAELRVLHGAQELARRCLPAFFIEVDDSALRQMGASAEAVCHWLEQHGYSPFRLTSAPAPVPLTVEHVIQSSRRGLYSDVLWLPRAPTAHANCQ